MLVAAELVRDCAMVLALESVQDVAVPQINSLPLPVAETQVVGKVMLEAQAEEKVPLAEVVRARKKDQIVVRRVNVADVMDLVATALVVVVVAVAVVARPAVAMALPVDVGAVIVVV